MKSFLFVFFLFFSTQGFSRDLSGLIKKVEEGNPKASFIYGLILDKGIWGAPLDRDRALELFTFSAKKGVAKAQYFLGYMYFFGDGVEQDTSRGLELLEQSGRQGHAEAKYLLSVIYLEGLEGVEKDKPRAFALLKEAVSKGHPPALFYSGQLLLDGEEFPKNEKNNEKGLNQLKFLADRFGDTDALYELATRYYEDSLIPQNLKLALKYLREASRKGDLEAMYLLADLLLWGADESLTARKAGTEARKLLETVLDHRPAHIEAGAHNLLGVNYFKGIFFPKSYKKAKFHFEQAIELGSQKESLYHLGLIHRDGLGVGVKKDPVKANQLFVESAKLGYVDAMYYVGVGMLKGENGFEQNESRARDRYLIPATKEGHGEASLIVGEFYLERGEKGDLDLAKERFHVAAEHGIEEASLKLNQIYQEEKKSSSEKEVAEVGKENLERAPASQAQRQRQTGLIDLSKTPLSELDFSNLNLNKVSFIGEAEALVFVANKLVEEAGQSLNMKLAIKKAVEVLNTLFLKDSGHVEASYLMAKIFSEGRGVKKNANLVVRHVNHAADFGFAKALTLRAELHLHGWGFPRGQMKKVFEDLEAAEKKNEPRALFILGRTYSNGKSVPVDMDKALGFLKRSASLNYAPAQDLLGHIFLNGLHGVKIDYEQALLYLKPAAEKNEHRAITLLGRMHLEGLGIKKDVPEAIRLFEKSRALNPNGGVAFLLGKALMETSPSRGIKMLEEASKLGHPQALFLLARIRYFNQDFERYAFDVIDLLKKAASKKNPAPEALFMHAVILLDGDGVPKDIPEAKKLLSQAMELGLNEARVMLEEILPNKKEIPEEFRELFSLNRPEKEVASNKEKETVAKNEVKQVPAQSEIKDTASNEFKASEDDSKKSKKKKRSNQTGSNEEKKVVAKKETAPKSEVKETPEVVEAVAKKTPQTESSRIINTLSENPLWSKFIESSKAPSDEKGEVIQKSFSAVSIEIDSENRVKTPGETALWSEIVEASRLPKDAFDPSTLSRSESFDVIKEAFGEGSKSVSFSNLRLSETSLFETNLTKLNLERVHFMGVPLLEAVSQEIPEAQYLLAGLLLAEADESLSSSQRGKRARRLLEAALKKAPTYLQDSIRYLLATIYYRRLGLKKVGFHTAKDYLIPLADRGHMGAIALKGEMQLKGAGFEKDYEKALGNLEIAAEKNEPRALFILGLIHLNGQEVKQDVSLAAKYFERSANLGHPLAQNQIGKMYFEGDGVGKDYVKARQYLEASLGKNSGANTFLTLGLIYIEGLGVEMNVPRGFEFLEKARAINPNGRASYLIGRTLVSGVGIKKDIPEGVKYLEQAAKGGHSQALFLLAKLRYFGRGFGKHVPRAVALLEKVAKSRRPIPEAVFMHAVILLEGDGVPKNVPEAKKLLSQAMELGLNEARVMLEEILPQEKEIPKEYKELYSLYELEKKSAEELCGESVKQGPGGL